ncbi:hypothetical protein BJ875DRAFT_502838 [Amylocarpus encephaloides]|uniref:Uncharacterized protein n=1 Tax=Amylocarpus encephaloides TaxID=45428 RepID=A0A9P8C8B3_9HELO|nr:hypothetical protein BJ875DRAFT_502838 [Amylocarpus encephaloides]
MTSQQASHTYIPRSDGAIVVGGIAYFPEAIHKPSTAAAATASIPVATMASIPGFPEPQYYPYFHPSPNNPSYPTAPELVSQAFMANPHAAGVKIQMMTAHAMGLDRKQDMKPADDDPLRFYWVREFDGSWTQRNRLTIDSGDIGDCRWYAKDGEFYAVRLET